MVGAEQQPLNGPVGPVVVVALVAVKPVGPEDGALDQPGDDLIADVVWDLPAERVGAEFDGPVMGDARGGPRALGVELGAVAEADQDVAAPVGVGDRQPLELALGLAAVEHRLERAAGQIVGYALVLEHADHDRVGARFGGILGGGLHFHREDPTNALLGFTQAQAASGPRPRLRRHSHRCLRP